MIEVARDSKLQADGKIWPKFRNWVTCEAFDGSAALQDWLNENPELREKYLDWYEAKYVKVAGMGGTA